MVTSASPESLPDNPTPEDEPVIRELAVIETDGVIDQEPIEIEHMDVDLGEEGILEI